MGARKGDIVSRGMRGPSPLGTSIFIALRAIEPLVQRAILRTSPLTTTILPRLGLSIPPPPAHHLATSTPVISTLHLDLTPFQTLLFLMSVAAAAKQIFWLLITSREQMTAGGAATIAAFNLVVNAANTLLFTLAAANPTYAVPSSIYVGVALFALGIVVEPLAELQRARFKDDPRNAGKPYAGGLFALARNVNYAAYTVWRTGFALAGGGPVWAAMVGSFFVWDFGTRAIPVLEDYCRKRYGVQWAEVERKVPYKLFPGIY